MKVLLAEDDPYTRNALKEILEAEGYSVIAVPDGAAAWTSFRQEGADLACLDIMMPGLSGYEVCRRIRDAGSRIPVLFISAKSEEIDTVLGLELGADDYITKPFGARELGARIRAVLRRTSALMAQSGAPTARSGGAIQSGAVTVDAAFSFGPWRVEPSELRAYKDGSSVDLTSREVCLLATLHRLRGKVVNRAAFFRSCWGWEDLPQSRTLDQHIATLRKKIEANPRKPEFIETVQGVGYRMP